MSDDRGVNLSQEDIDALRAERDALLAERDAERTAREVESRRADGLESQVTTYGRANAEAQIANLAAQESQAEQAIAARGAEISDLKRQFAELQAEGKFTEAADVQEKLGIAVAKREQAEQAKTYYGQQRDHASRQPVDPIDRFFAANPQFTEPERDWIKKNPRYATDRDFQMRVNAAHAEAINGGAQRFSADYWASLEQKGYMRSAPAPRPAPTPARSAGGAADPDPDVSPYSDAADPDAVIVEDPPVNIPPPRPRASAAPPSRRAPASPAPRVGETRLTPDQAETALKMSEYAPDEVLAEGEAGIYKWWATLNNSPYAQRLRREWSGAA